MVTLQVSIVIMFLKSKKPCKIEHIYSPLKMFCDFFFNKNHCFGDEAE